MLNVGFIGLGRMGSGVCKNLIINGYQMTVFDIDASKLDQYKGKANVAKDVINVFSESEITFFSLPASIQVEEITDRFLSYGVKGKTVIDLSTSFPISTKKIYESFKKEGGNFADASLTGSPAQADEGKLAVVFGGDIEVFDKYKPVLDSFSRAVYYMGGSGAGNLTKLANNYLAVMYNMLYAEIFPLAEKMGMDTNRLFEVLGDSGVNCPIYQSGAGRISKKDYYPTFALNLALKDMTYVKKMFEELQVPSFILDGGLNLLRCAKAQGLGEKDTTEAARVQRRLFGLE